jgi:hypothetical protein
MIKLLNIYLIVSEGWISNWRPNSGFSRKSSRLRRQAGGASITWSPGTQDTTETRVKVCVEVNVAVLKRGMLLKIEKRPLLLLLALLPVLAQLKKKSRVLLLIVEWGIGPVAAQAVEVIAEAFDPWLSICKSFFLINVIATAVSY